MNECNMKSYINVKDKCKEKRETSRNNFEFYESERRNCVLQIAMMNNVHFMFNIACFFHFNKVFLYSASIKSWIICQNDK